MASIWNGNIRLSSFVVFPVKVHVLARREKAIELKEIHCECNERVSTIKWCETCDREIEDYGEIVKGYARPDGKWEVFSKDEVDRLKGKGQPELEKVLSVEYFVKESEVDPIFYEEAYDITPDKQNISLPAFSLFYKLLKDKKLAAVACWKMKSNTDPCYLFLRAAKGRTITAHKMYFAEDVRENEEVKLSQVNPVEFEYAVKLANDMTRPFDHSMLKNMAQNNLAKEIERRIKEKPLAPPKKSKKPVKHIESADSILLQQLKKSAAGKG